MCTYADLDPGSCLYYHNMFSQLHYVLISLIAPCSIKLLKLPFIIRALFFIVALLFNRTLKQEQNNYQNKTLRENK